MRSPKWFAGDDRAIEGLPIRLVIALVVGVAALGIMMNMLTGIGSLTTTEATVEVDEAIVADDGEVEIAVVTDEGDPIEGSTVVLSSGSARIDDIVHVETGEDDNTVTVDFGSHSGDDAEVGFDTNQDMGTLQVEIIPPSDDFADERGNPEIRIKKT